MPMPFFTRFLRSQYFSGFFLIFTTAAALVLANSPLAGAYQDILHQPFGFTAGFIKLKMSLGHWVNDGLMALFFLLMGLEIKREFLRGELSSRDKAVLPLIAALGGVVAPALIFMVLNRAHPENWNGWAIPTATDIAFALGLLALGGKQVPAALKVFLMALAIIDDLVAIVIIALFYGEPLNIDAFFAATAFLFILFGMNLFKVSSALLYLALGFLLWLTILGSGLHPTLAGVLLALFIPIGDEEHSPLHRLEALLRPLSSYVIVPLFALANAGLSLTGLKLADMLAPLPLGIITGLFFGKQIGIFLASFIAVRMRWAKLPSGVSWPRFYAVAILAGVGFTMSLFIGTLGFHNEALHNHVRLGVIAGSVLSAIVGLSLLWLAPVIKRLRSASRVS